MNGGLFQAGTEEIPHVNDFVLTLEGDDHGNDVDVMALINSSAPGVIRAVEATLFPTDGDDVINGTGSGDTIEALAGNDTVFEAGGADTVFAGLGDDSVVGGLGADTIVGGSGNDRLAGGDQFDTIYAGEGRDTVWGGNGRDVVYLNQGDDVFFDNAQGGDLGVDVVFAGLGRDTVLLGAGNDRYVDTAQAGFLGEDTITGGIGADTFVFGAVMSADVITDFTSGVDQLQFAQATWGGGLSTQQVVNQFASVQGGNVVFDFGNGRSVTLEGVGSTAGLANDLISV